MTDPEASWGTLGKKSPETALPEFPILCILPYPQKLLPIRLLSIDVVIDAHLGKHSEPPATFWGIEVLIRRDRPGDSLS